MPIRRASPWLVSAAALALLAAPATAQAAGGVSVTASIAYETRAEFIRSLDIALGLPPAAGPSLYTDVPASSPFYGYIQAATEAGFVDGVGDHLFAPNAPITRAEAAKIEVLAYGAGAAAARIKTTSFKDEASIPHWAVGYVGEAAALGLLRGFPNGTFGPDQKLTQAEDTSLISQLEAALAKATPTVAVGSASVDGVTTPVLTNSRGMTLYYFTKDTPTMSACTGACSSIWPPLLVPDGVAVTPHNLGGTFSIVNGGNGPQLAYDGHLLYTYAGDSAPGQASGVAIPGWYAATPMLDVAAALRTVSVDRGTAMVRGANETVLTNAEGMTLYYLDKDTATSVACSGSCAEIWPPLTATVGAYVDGQGIPGTFGLVDGPNGEQVEYNGHPLYTFIGDTAPGEATGDGFKGIWHVATPGLAPPAGTATVTISTGTADVAGTKETVLTDQNGMTLYYLTKDAPDAIACTATCAKIWPPLTVAAGTVVSFPASLPGDFTIVPGPNGDQVEYDGHPLYTFSQDTAPGQATGQGFKGIWFVATPNLSQ